MKKTSISILCTLSTLCLWAAERKWAPVPVAVSGNAVVALKVNKQRVLFSFMGIGDKKTWNEVTNRVFGLNMETGKWSEYRSVPGPAGRLAASAVVLKDVVYLLGGYTLDREGEENAVRSVEVLVPSKNIWYRGQDMPVALADFVAGQYRARYLYTLGGRSETAPLNAVAVYDAEKNQWKAATPLPGPATFGSAGAVVEDTIIYIDGALENPSAERPIFTASNQCWMGKIDHHDPSKIQWTKMEGHPGRARFHIAAGVQEREHKIYFSGGTDKPIDFNGIGYDGTPAQPVPTTFAWNLRTNKWELVKENTPNAIMESRALVALREGLVLIGGMDRDRKTTARVTVMERK